MFFKTLFTGLLIIFSLPVTGEPALAKFAIYSQATVNIELTGYNGLTDSTLFKGVVSAGSSREIDTSYRGLALLICEDGQRYPLIVGDEFFTLNMSNPDEPPSFTDGGENAFFYKELSGGDSEGKQYSFALLMLQAKQLLESSHSIRTIAELSKKRVEYLNFVQAHYQGLEHSDMVGRLIAQYFMMHEYVDYHTDGAPASDIKVKYQQAIFDGVGNWMKILEEHIPEHEMLNYCVSLYYNRSMVTLATLIIEHYKEIAYCPGDEGEAFIFPDDLRITDANGNRETRLNELYGNKTIAFVSDDCPVSMVETISKARQQVEQKESKILIVASMQGMSDKISAMNRMVSGGNIFFVNDVRWQQDNLSKKLRLPLFHQISASID